MCYNQGMIASLEAHLDSIREVCQRYHVAKLEVFGPAVDEDRFDPRRSDVDFIVEFVPDTDLGPWMKVYFELREELQTLLGRPVELVMKSAMTSSLFRDEADRTRKQIYAAANTEAA
jgi:predicted nucleotidyltransferase